MCVHFKRNSNAIRFSVAEVEVMFFSDPIGLESDRITK